MWSQDELKQLQVLFPDDVRVRQDGSLWASVTKEEVAQAIRAYPSLFPEGLPSGRVPKGEEDLAKAYPSMYSGPKD